MPEKIQMRTPLVEMDGDEMTRVMWRMVKDILLTPYVSLNTVYFDLDLENRRLTDDRVTSEAAESIKQYGVGVKCATITPNPERAREYNLPRLYPSPNATIRAVLDGTVFRKPILVKNIRPAVSFWKRPIVVGRHAYGDVYKNAEYPVQGRGRTELVFTSEQGEETRLPLHSFEGPGIVQGIHNTDASIEGFARACFNYALTEGIDVWFGAKDTISQTYDRRFKEIFERVFREEFEERLGKAGLRYEYDLIDTIVSRVMKSEGGMLWACKNYDGDVMSDMVASAFGSLAMMTSVLVSPAGQFEYEAAHGTVQKHYQRRQRGEKTSTNPMALIFAWSGALRRRGQSDNIPELAAFAERLEQASIETIESGQMTGDLLPFSDPKPEKTLYTEEFLEEVAQRLGKKEGLSLRGETSP